MNASTSPPPSTPPPSCVSMNDFLWELRRDLTTQPWVMALFGLLYCTIIVAGVMGNLCVILAIARTRSLQTVPNMFILFLSCSDVVVCCTSATITPITAFKKEWLFGPFLCSVAPFIAGVSLCFSTFTLAAISIDRCILIRFPMRKPFTHPQAFFIICFICLLSMGLSAPSMFMQTLRAVDRYCGEFCYEDWGSNANQRRAYGTLMLTLQFIIPLSVIVACYTAISLKLGQSLILKNKNQQQRQQGSGYGWKVEMSEQQRTATKRRQRTNRMFIGMCVAFSGSWISTIIFNLLRDYDILPQFIKDQEFFYGILTHCIAMTSTVWNPILYALLNLQLRAAFLQLMPACLKSYCRCICWCCYQGRQDGGDVQLSDEAKFGRNTQSAAFSHSPMLTQRTSVPANDWNGHSQSKTVSLTPTTPSRRPLQQQQPNGFSLLHSTSFCTTEQETCTPIQPLEEEEEEESKQPPHPHPPAPTHPLLQRTLTSESQANSSAPQKKYGSFEAVGTDGQQAMAAGVSHKWMEGQHLETDSA